MSDNGFLRSGAHILALFVLAGALPLKAAQAGETLANGKNTVEFIGLEKLSAIEIHRQLGGEASRPVHYCAADLLAKTEVAAASVVVHPREGGGTYTIVTVLEKARAGEGRLRTATAGGTIDAAKLAPLAAVLDADESLRNVVHLFGAARLRLSSEELAKQMEELYGEVPGTEPAFGLLDSLQGDEVAQIATAAMLHEAPTSIRRAAIAALANSADREETWRAIVVACIDSDEKVRDDARTALLGLHRFGVRKVDWNPARAEIEQLLFGANLWALPAVVETLVATQIDATLARQIVSDAPRLLLACAAANHPPTHLPARRLLALAVGQDFGSDIQAWRAAVEAMH